MLASRKLFVPAAAGAPAAPAATGAALSGQGGRRNPMRSAATSLFVWAAATLALALSSPATAQTRLLFSSFTPLTQVINQRVFPAWIKEIETATQGRVKIEMSPGSLAPPPGQLDLVQSGGADIAWQFGGLVPHRLAMNQMLQIPSPTASAETMTRALWRTHEKFFGPANEYKGLKLMALFTFGANYFFTVREPLNSVAQIRQMKVLTVPGSDAKAWGSLTTGVVTSPVARYFELVSKGTVDAYTSTPIEPIVSFHLWKNTKYIVDLRDAKNASGFAVVMNEARWNSIPRADQAALDKVSGEAFAKYMKGVDEVAEEASKKLAAEGVQRVAAPDAVVNGVRQAYTFAESDWLAEAAKRGVDGRAALAFYRAQIREAAK